MISKIAYFEELRHAFPEMMSKEQFYKVAHISKATALYLLRSGKFLAKIPGRRHGVTAFGQMMSSFI